MSTLTTRSPALRQAVEEEITALRYTAALFDTLKHPLADPVDYDHVLACYTLTTLGVAEGVKRLYQSIDQLLSTIAAAAQPEEER